MVILLLIFFLSGILYFNNYDFISIEWFFKQYKRTDTGVHLNTNLVLH